MPYAAIARTNTQSDLPLFTSVVPVREFTSSAIKYRDVIQPVATSLQAALTKQEPEDKSILEARKILGELAKDLSTEELQDIVTEIKFLTNSWIDEFERQLFEGKTLLEVLHEKG